MKKTLLRIKLRRVREGVRKLICRNCGQEFTPMKGHEGRNLCPKCFINELNHVAANNSNSDPAAKKTMMDQPTDQPKPTDPGAPAEPPAAPPATPPASSPTGEEPAIPEPVTPTPGVSTPVPEGEEPAGEGGESPAGGDQSSVPPVV